MGNLRSKTALEKGVCHKKTNTNYCENYTTHTTCEEISFCGSAGWEGIVGPGDCEEGDILFVSLEVSLRAYGVLCLFSKTDQSKIDLQTFLFLSVLKDKCNTPQPPTINTNTHLLLYSPCRTECMA